MNDIAQLQLEEKILETKETLMNYTDEDYAVRLRAKMAAYEEILELAKSGTKESHKTNADCIRSMTDDEIADLLVWGIIDGNYIPDCDEGCEGFKGGCANGCPPEIREKAIKEWLKKEIVE